MTRKSITTSHAVLSCDVCGRTLLRGEEASPFIAGGARRLVCELCTARAAHEGWIREGVDDSLSARGNGRERRGSLLQRLRSRPRREPDPPPARGSRRRPEPDRGERGAPAPEPAAESLLDDRPAYAGEDVEAAPVARPAPEPPPEHEPEPESEPVQERAAPREPRHVHAIPTNADLKMARALELFNGSEHRRTVSGITRSLGDPLVMVRPSTTEGSLVSIVVGWELSWYRYEVDLADEAAGVRVVEQGTELEELPDADRDPNATADASGALTLAA
jgi:hypothetical protein